MIRLKCEGIDTELKWTDEIRMNELVIEAPVLLRKILRSLTNPESGVSVVHFTNDGKEMKIEKEIDVIFNPLRLDFNNKRVIATLFKMLVKTSLAEDFYMKTNEFKARVVKYLDELVDAEDYVFEVSTDEFAMDNIAKALNLHIVDDEDDFVELLTEYMVVMAELAGVKMFVFLNLRELVLDEEMVRLMKNLENHQLDVLLLEGNAFEVMKKVKRVVIDKDLCEV